MSSAEDFSNPVYFDSNPKKYAFAIAATLLVLLLAGATMPAGGRYMVYLVLLAATAFSAAYCGLGPTVLAIAIAFVGVRYWFVSPIHSFSKPDGLQIVGMLAFVAASSVVLAIGERNRRRMEALRESHEDLEERLRKRSEELDIANQGLGDLTARLMQLQDEERRRIARELHDSAGQSLTALALNLSNLGTEIERLTKSAKTVSDSVVIVNDMSRDIRTISYLLHPPLLDEAGLASALRWYIRGFTERSGIKVELGLPEDFERLPRDVETAIFRLVQECLTNIHRHSESPTATIGIVHANGEVRIEVRDQGKGIAPDKKLELLSAGTPGVGIRGMRERLRQLGGTMEINSVGNGSGTQVVVQLPVGNVGSNLAVGVSAGSTSRC
jgi:signal transduction histidine kinase